MPLKRSQVELMLESQIPLMFAEESKSEESSPMRSQSGDLDEAYIPAENLKNISNRKFLRASQDGLDDIKDILKKVTKDFTLTYREVRDDKVFSA